LYERLHPETKHGAVGRRGKSSQNATSFELADAFIDDTAKKTGKHRATVARKAARAKKVAVLPDIVGTSLDKGAEIDALAKLPVEKQRSYTRNWQLRVVKDFGSWASLGVSVENPAELVYANIGAVANGGNVGGWLVNWSNPGNSFLGSGAFNNNFNADVAPDIIGKAAFDPGWGHYEVFGIARFFNDNTFGCVVAPLTTPAGPGGTPPAQTAGLCSTITANTLVPGAQSQKTKSGDGVGGSMLLPIIPKFLDFQASTMYGRGIGRYGAGQLSDVVVAPDGSLSARRRPRDRREDMAGLCGRL
jgi:hypothetical protein